MVLWLTVKTVDSTRVETDYVLQHLPAEWKQFTWCRRLRLLKILYYFRAFITFPSIISIGVSSGERSVKWCALFVSLSELRLNASWASCSERKKTTLTDPQNAGCVHQKEQQAKKSLKMAEGGRDLWRWCDLNPPAHRTALWACRLSIAPEEVTPQPLWSVNRFRDK